MEYVIAVITLPIMSTFAGWLFGGHLLDPNSMEGVIHYT